MKVIELSVSELIPYEKNPRKNDGAVDYVANSIKTFGFRQPIVIDKNNVVVCGHTRLLAAKKLGLETVPCVMADDLSEEQIRAYRLADNKVAEMSGWDHGVLDLELEALSDFDMSEFGFVTVAEDIDLDSMFEDAPKKEKEPKKVQCPHCGEWFEI